MISTMSSYDDIVTTDTSDFPPPLPEHEEDILLLDFYDKHDYAQVERHLSDEVGCPVKLLISKNIFSENKEIQRYFHI
jgi:hypothetical protein